MNKVLVAILLGILFSVMPCVSVSKVWAADEPVQVFINSDGGVSPSYAPVSTNDDVTYTLTGNISYPTFLGLVVNRSNIILDGNGNTVQGNNSRGEDNSGGEGVSLSYLTNVTITNINVEDFNYGVYLYSTNYTTIANSTATANQAGFLPPRYPPVPYTAAIFLFSSSFDTVNGFNITGIDNGYAGIALDDSSNNTIQQNKVYSNNASGIGLIFSSYNNIIGNNLSGNEGGIDLSGSDNNTVSKNTAVANDYGISLDYSSGNELRNNIMENNTYNFGVNSVSNSYDLADFVNDVDSSNAVNGKSVYYWVNESNMNLPVDAGCVVLVNCSGINVQETNPSLTSQGILLAYTTNSTVAQNNLTSDEQGIVLYGSQNDSVVCNRFVHNYQSISVEQSSGISLDNNTAADLEQISIVSSTNDTIRGNNISFIELNFNSNDSTLTGNTGYIDVISSSFDTITENNATGGISLAGSSNCTITGNLLENNQIGLQLSYSMNNTIYHNDFINNTVQVSIDSTSPNNIWNEPYPSGGNYWSDYQSFNPNATQIDSSEIWNTPYVINANNTDNYPLMTPVTTVPELPEPLILAVFTMTTLLAIAIYKKRHSCP